MALRDATELDMKNVRLILTLVNGVVVGPADTTSSPFGDAEMMVAVWEGERLALYPLSNVAKIELVFGE